MNALNGFMEVKQILVQVLCATHKYFYCHRTLLAGFFEKRGHLRDGLGGS